jgi:hypothetical protein
MTETQRDRRAEPAGQTGRRLARASFGAVVGMVTAGVALAVGELIAIVTGPSSAPVFAVGSAAMDLAPARFAIREFGTTDQRVLIEGILVCSR